MATVKAELGVSDQELLSNAMSDEPVKEQAVAEPEPKQDGQLRDEQGRFAKAETVETPEPKQEAEPVAQTEQPKPDADAQVPSWRLRELREAREASDRRAQEAENRAVRIEGQLRQLQAQLQEKQQPPPDMFADPNAWQQHQAQQNQSSIEKVRFELSEDWARDKYGDEKVESALKWSEQNLDQAGRVRIEQARNPYREMVRLYDERQTLQQIGGDLNAYRERLSSELLNDPAFMQKVAEKLRGTPSNGQRPTVQIPPSLNKATGSGNSAEGLTEADMSHEALYRHATAR